MTAVFNLNIDLHHTSLVLTPMLIPANLDRSPIPLVGRGNAGKGINI